MLANVCSSTGVTWLLEHSPRRACLIVLNYHRIGDPSTHPFDRGVFSATPEAFDEQISLLKKHYAIATKDEVVEYAEHPEKLDRATLLLTFDDGCLDNHQLAFPILKSHGVQAIFFLPTSYIGTERLPWWDEIAFAVRTSKNRILKLSYPRPATFNLDQDIDSCIRGVLTLYKDPAMSDASKFMDELLQATEVTVPASPEYRVFMNWNEAAEMAARGMAIGSHTHSHELLGRQTFEAQVQELETSRAILKEKVGVHADTLAFPVGSPTSFNEDTFAALRNLGYKAAFSFYGGINFPAAWNRFNLLRVGVEPELSPARLRLGAALAATAGKQLF